MFFTAFTIIKIWICTNFCHKQIGTSFCANMLSTKNYKAKLLVEKSQKKHFGMKKLLVKSW